MLMLRHLLRRREGQGMAEYALILALVAVVAILALQYLGPKVRDLFYHIGDHI